MPNLNGALIAAILVLYLYDSLLLLSSNEVVFFCRNGRWSFFWPSSDWIFLRKHPYLPNPFIPNTPLFRVHWSYITSAPQQSLEPCFARFFQSLSLPSRINQALAILMLIFMPTILLAWGPGAYFLCLVVIMYGLIVAMLYVVAVRRDDLGLTKKRFWALAFDVLACPPNALNLVRKLGLQQPSILDPLNFSQQHFDSNTFSRLLTLLHGHLNEQIAASDENSEAAQSLSQYRDTLRKLPL